MVRRLEVLMWTDWHADVVVGFHCVCVWWLGRGSSSGGVDVD